MAQKYAFPHPRKISPFKPSFCSLFRNFSEPQLTAMSSPSSSPPLSCAGMSTCGKRLLFQLFLCLSRACLGKMILFSSKGSKE